MAEKYGEATSVLDWRDRLVCSKCGSRGNLVKNYDRLDEVLATMDPEER